jgi:hypothetical protein
MVVGRHSSGDGPSDVQYKATTSALISSNDAETSPRTDPGVWPGPYHDVLKTGVSVRTRAKSRIGLHGLAGERVDKLFGVEVLLAVSIFLE